LALILDKQNFAGRKGTKRSAAVAEDRAGEHDRYADATAASRSSEA
jgi:hypothetical protein